MILARICRATRVRPGCEDRTSADGGLRGDPVRSARALAVPMALAIVCLHSSCQAPRTTAPPASSVPVRYTVKVGDRWPGLEWACRTGLSYVHSYAYQYGDENVLLLPAVSSPPVPIPFVCLDSKQGVGVYVSAREGGTVEQIALSNSSDVSPSQSASFYRISQLLIGDQGHVILDLRPPLIWVGMPWEECRHRIAAADLREVSLPTLPVTLLRGCREHRSPSDREVTIRPSESWRRFWMHQAAYLWIRYEGGNRTTCVTDILLAAADGGLPLRGPAQDREAVRFEILHLTEPGGRGTGEDWCTGAD